MNTLYRPVIYSANIGWLAGIMLLVVFLTYRSFIVPVFYLSWLAGVISLGVFAATLLLSWRMASVSFYALLTGGSWLIVALALTPFTSHPSHHISIAIVCFFYVLVAIALADFMLRSRISMSQLTYGMLFCWVLLSGMLLIAFFAGLYQPAKDDFSGLFHDRNVFSITSLIVLVLSFAFLRPSKLSSIHRTGYFLLVLLIFAMVFISRSVTGLLGLGLFLVFYASSLRLRHSWLLLVVGLGLLVALVIFDQGILERIQRFSLAGTGQTDQLQQTESAYIRLYLLLNGAELAWANLWTGVGLDNARWHILWPGRETGTFLHNTYLDILTSGGVLLFLCYYLPQWWVIGWLLARRKVIRKLPLIVRQAARAALYLLVLKLFYDLTWTTYFEFAMVFSVVFAFYCAFYVRQGIKKYESNVCG